MRRLSSPIADIAGHYDVVVVGSGYGGAIAASRLARATPELSVCVLERGRELHPGDYPDTPAAVLAESQVDTPTRRPRSPTGLYDFRVNNEINVFVGCGLGGTSLINANVSLWPEDAVFEDAQAWPAGLRRDMAQLLTGRTRAEAMLQPTPYPAPPDAPPLRKHQALKQSGDYLARRYPATFDRTQINVSFTDGPNPARVEQHACGLCGDCVSGCNFGSKNTLLMNYLPDAARHGARIFTEVSVRRLERSGDRWCVHYELLGAGRERFAPEPMTLSADLVILAAGTLGSTEILLRSREHGLVLSDELGSGFSANGDTFALAYNTEAPVNGVGAGRRRPNPKEPVGPCITGMIDMRGRADFREGVVIQEGSIPGALAGVIPAVLGGAALLFGGDTTVPVKESLREEARRLLKYLRGPYHGAVRNTLTFLVMSHDDAGGRMSLRDDRLRIDWPGVDERPMLAEVERRLREATRELGGTFLKNPFNPVTVHPLGGCRMADGAKNGVVDHEGRVFSAHRGGAVYAGLYVCDGSVIPRSLGANPLLTISALAERMCDLMAQRRRWRIR